MPIETICPGCGRRLSVGDIHAGKQARCPACNAIYEIPLTSEATQAGGDKPNGDRWSMRTPEGHNYGPVPRQELDRWVAEGRVTGDCLVRQEGGVTWLRADAVYSALQSGSVAQPAQPVASFIPSTPFATSPAQRPRRLESHRGALILALGILSWLSCPLFGVLAWVLGSADLRQMHSGRMDPEGLTLTQAGRILGMIHVLLCIAILMAVTLLLVLIGITGAH